MERFRLLEMEPALSRPNWLPTGDAWPELAERRAQHERLLAAIAQVEQETLEAWQGHDAAEKAHAAELQAAFLEGREPDEPKERQPPEVRAAEVADLQSRANAAMAALNQFLEETLAEIKERAPEWYALLEERQAEVEVRREEARRLLAEADASVGETERMRVWLARATGKSPLGQHAFAEMPVPTTSHTQRAAEAQELRSAYV